MEKEILITALTSILTSGTVVFIMKELFKKSLDTKMQKYLDDLSAERSYKYEAKKRLYFLISPLQFQIVIACKDLSSRISRYVTQGCYDLKITEYYGQSTLYRLLKPLALLEIVERKIAFADFSVDPEAIELLKLRNHLFTSLSSSTITLNHPEENWDKETGHICFDNVSKLASNFIRKEDNIEVVLTFNEFQENMKYPEYRDKFKPLTDIFNDFSIDKNPIFWLRLIALGNVSHEYSEKYAQKIGLESEVYNIRSLLEKSSDITIKARLEEYLFRIKKVRNET